MGYLLQPMEVIVFMENRVPKKTGNLIAKTHNMMKEKEIDPARLRMAAMCSVCSESFVKQMRNFNEYLLKTLHA